MSIIYNKVSSSFRSSLFSPSWRGVQTKLIRKTTLVEHAYSTKSPEHSGADRLAVHTLTFEIPEDQTFGGSTIAHSEIRIDLGDFIKIVLPNDKPKSYALSALRSSEKEMDVTIEVDPKDKASKFLDSLEVGDTIRTYGMRTKKSRNAGKFFGGIAHGLGITEILPVAEAELEKGDAEKVVVLWASGTCNEKFLCDKVAELKKLYPEKFEMVYMYSRDETQDSDILKGRISPQVLKKVFEPHINATLIMKKEVRFLALGAKEMVDNTRSMLSQIGYPMPKYALFPK